jgi:hypothetical protein
MNKLRADEGIPDQMHNQAPLYYDDQFIVW